MKKAYRAARALARDELQQLVEDFGNAALRTNEPDLINKFAKGHEKATCISCNGCFNPNGIRCILE